MRAITIRQPWAWAVILGGKNIENRTQLGMWRAAVGQTVAIHAAQRWSERGAREVPALAGRGWQSTWFDGADAVPAGAVIGVVDVDDVHPAAGCCEPWGEQAYQEADGPTRRDVVHLVLTNPRPLPVPIPCRGKLGLWHVDPDVDTQVRADLASNGVSA